MFQLCLKMQTPYKLRLVLVTEIIIQQRMYLLLLTSKKGSGTLEVYFQVYLGKSLHKMQFINLYFYLA